VNGRYIARVARSRFSYSPHKQRGAPALAGGAYTPRRVSCGWAGAATSNAGARQIWCGYRGSIPVLVLHSARVRRLSCRVEVQRASAERSANICSSYRPGVYVSRRGQRFGVLQRTPRDGDARPCKDMSGRYAGPYASRSVPVFLTPSGTATLGKGARTPNACVNARRSCGAGQGRARESCEKAPRSRAAPAASRATHCSAATSGRLLTLRTCSSIQGRVGSPADGAGTRAFRVLWPGSIAGPPAQDWG